MSSKPLLPRSLVDEKQSPPESPSAKKQVSSWIVFVGFGVLILYHSLCLGLRGQFKPDGSDPLALAKYYLKSSPVIDGHIDLPEFARGGYKDDPEAFDLNDDLPMHFDIPRARKGHLGGFFWSIFAGCQSGRGDDFLTPQDEVRDTLEQIDVATNLIHKYSDTFAFCKTADDVDMAIKKGKIASIFGLEGGHSLGNSLGVLRVMHTLGIRYMTLTHACNNAFGDSAGIFKNVDPVWGGLSPFGKDLIYEMNRLGILVDISHVSDSTALQALSLTRAPVIFSHSAVRHFRNITRNAPDEVLDRIGEGEDKVDGVIMVNFSSDFIVDNGRGTASDIADQIEYIAKRIGKHHVGIGSDYDGVESTPEGLDDVSQYPNLFAELIKRGWNQKDLALVAGGNVLRVMRGMEKVSLQMAKEGAMPKYTIYDKRGDMAPWHRVRDL